MARGYLNVVLHGHLPYVRHPEHDHFLEERWFFEALTESYIPLVSAFDRLLEEGVRFRLTVSLSPTLLAMLGDPLLQTRYLRYLDLLEKLAERELRRTRGETAFQRLAGFYRDRLGEARLVFQGRYGRDLSRAFEKYRDLGVMELITTSATHGYLPALQTQPSAVRAQVVVAVEAFNRRFGGRPRGFWLPECGYFPGLEATLRDQGIRHFTVEAHGLLHASFRPHYGLAAPIACENGVAAFGRDPEAARQVWSSAEGYPGDPVYREFYRDIGFDLEFKDVRALSPDGRTRVYTGFKYYRVTGPTDQKEPYDPHRAARRAAEHADHFLRSRWEQIQRQAPQMDVPPVITVPFDAELLGHWWYEGPIWLEALLRRTAAQNGEVEFITPTDYLTRHPTLQKATPSASSWGAGGFNGFWINTDTDWMLPYLHDAARKMEELAGAHREEPEGTLADRALRQAARSLLLAQASDWGFIMRNGTAVEYAHQRVRDHLARFNALMAALAAGEIDSRRLAALEALDPLFAWVDFRVFAPLPRHGAAARRRPAPARRRLTSAARAGRGL